MHAVTVEIAGILLGMDVQEVREVWRASDVLAVPKAPPVIIGLVNRRGAVVTLVHGHKVLDVPMEPELQGREDHEMVILEHDGQQLAVAVSRLVDTIEVDPARVLPVPPNLAAGVQRIATGVHAGPEALTVLTSAQKIFDFIRSSANQVPSEVP